jgi:hypothetical protein
LEDVEERGLDDEAAGNFTGRKILSGKSTSLMSFFPNMSRLMVFKTPSCFEFEVLVRPRRIMRRAGRRTERISCQEATPLMLQLGQVNGGLAEEKGRRAG